MNAGGGAGTDAVGDGRAAAATDLLPAAEAVWPALAALLPGLTVEVLPEIDSTNTELMRRARGGCAAPVLLVARRQRAGRGRMGRSWQSEPGASLTFSLGLPLAPADWSGLSLAVGVALAESLHAQVRLKWPNDLWLHERKLAGILIETAAAAGAAARHAVIGVGINLACPPSAAGLSTVPAGLREVLPGAQPGEVLRQVAEPLLRAVLAFEQAGFAPFRPRYQALDALRGRAVTLSDGTAGVAAGVDGAGGLLVHTAGAVHTVTSSEVSVRPAT